MLSLYIHQNFIIIVHDLHVPIKCHIWLTWGTYNSIVFTIQPKLSLYLNCLSFTMTFDYSFPYHSLSITCFPFCFTLSYFSITYIHVSQFIHHIFFTFSSSHFGGSCFLYFISVDFKAFSKESWLHCNYEY